MKPLLGGKGANLAEMTRIGLPVPPGFTITTEVCTYFYAHTNALIPKELEAADRSRHRQHGKDPGQEVRRRRKPAARRRPFRRARFHARHDGHDFEPRPQRRNRRSRWKTPRTIARFAWDCYRRFIQMYGDVVMGVQKRAGEDHEPFETVIDSFKHEKYHGKNIEDTRARPLTT